MKIFEEDHYFHAPFFIFIKGITHLSNEEILKLLGFEEFQLVHPDPEEMPEAQYVYLTRDQNWVHIMDNWYYSLWHSKSFQNTITQLALDYEIFDCSVGDIDHSFSFNYYKEGKLSRRYVVTDPNFEGGEVSEDIGIPLASEEECLKITGDQLRVLSLATSLGIKIAHHQMTIECYDILKPQYSWATRQ